MCHCCAAPCVIYHWHRHVLLIAFAPHLFFLVVVFSLIMVWIACPRVGCVMGVRLCMVLVSVCCVGLGWFLWGGWWWGREVYIIML